MLFRNSSLVSSIEKRISILATRSVRSKLAHFFR